MFDFDKHLADIADQTVLCIGDLMLDEFVYGEVTRISPEAPTPVIAAKRSETMIGGAGNVARNLVSLGARCIFVGLIGDDDAGRTLKKALAKQRRIDARLVVDKSRQTTRKVRFVSEHFSTHLLRADWESASQVNRKAEAALIGHIAKAMKKADAVVLSDYAKGTLTGRVVRAAIEAARKAGKPVIVDPKGRDYGVYRGATLITPNRQELAEATRSAAGHRQGNRHGGGSTFARDRRQGRARHPQRSRHDIGEQGRPRARAGLSGARARCLRRR